MNPVFIPYGAYAEIINLVGKWKVIDLKSLLNVSSFDFKYKNLSKKVRFLEKEGFLKSVNLNRKSKHLYLAEKGVSLTSFDQTYEIEEGSLYHDLLVGVVLREVLSVESFYNGRMFHEIDDEHIAPDALISGRKNNLNYELALEIERTQKSSSRVKAKYFKYASSERYDYCLYITPKKTLYKAYRNFLEEMKKEHQSKIILMHCLELSPSVFNIKKSQCYFKGEERSFESIFVE